jgi:hypothetical protein
VSCRTTFFASFSSFLSYAEEVSLPLHEIRMQASDHLVEEYSGQMKDKENEVELADPLDAPLTLTIQS